MTDSARRLLRGNVLWLSIVSLLNDAASEMIYPLLPFFLLGTLGAGPALLGTIEGIAESTASFVKLASGWISDRFRRRKPLILGGYAIAAVARPLIALSTAPWHVLAIRFADRIGKGVRAAPRDALLAASVVPAERGLAFGLHRAADHAGSVIGPLLAAALLFAMPGRLRLVFALALVPGLVSIAIITWRVTEQDAAAKPAAAPASPADALCNRTLRRFLAVILLFTLGNATDAFLLLRARDLGVPLAAIPLLWAALHVSKMLFNIAGGALSDRHGPKRVIIAGWIVYAMTYAGFAWASASWHAWLLFTVYGLFYGLTEAPEKALIAAIAPEHRRGSAFGAYHCAVGIGALPASVLFGVVWAAAGAHTAFLMGAVIAAAAALLLPIAMRERA